MKTTVHRLALAACLFAVISSPAPALTLQAQRFDNRGESWQLQVPEGTGLQLLTARLDGPRLMHFMPNGDLLIGSKSGNIYRLAPPYDQPEILVELPGYPHSVAWRDGRLLIARSDGLYAAPYRPGQDKLPASDVRLLAPLPGGGGHTSRTVAVGPHGRIYVSLGNSGNCDDEFIGPGYPFERRRGGVMVLDENHDPPRFEPFASGLRNPVGMDWHPVSGVLYASNNGPDHLGFDQPPEYFARLEPGSFHGMPWFQYNGERIRRDRCIDSEPPLPAAQVREPVATFPARNAPMGVAFVPGHAMDARFANNAVVALRGSWGTRPDGTFFGSRATRRPPRLVMVRFSDANAVGVTDIVTGFQRPDGERLARPVGVAVGPDGALYFTSDSELQGLFRLRSRRRSENTAP